MIPFIQTKNGVTLYINSETHEVDRTHAQYQAILDLIKQDAVDAAEQIKSLLTKAITAIKTAVAAAPKSGVTFEDGQVKYNGEAIHNSLTDRMLRMIDEGFPVQPLVAFLEKLQTNPSFRVVNSLYGFLEAGGIPIAEDGDLYAYKAIRTDWTDIHSGTIDNSIGQAPQVPRNKVDEDANRTCSYGLHVCSWNYLPHFAHTNGRVVIVKVNPADVVAIPADYNNTKMRCARYEVVSEYLDYYTKDPHNLLSSRSVFSSSAFSSTSDDDLGVWEEEEEEEEDEELDHTGCGSRF